MVRLKQLLIFALAAVTLTGCDRDDTGGDTPDDNGTPGGITFDIGFAPQTRVSTGADFKSAWEAGDEIGVYAVRHDALADNAYTKNAKLIFDGAKWTPARASDFDLPWGWYDWVAADFYAYYPYDDNGGEPQNLDTEHIAFSAHTDQSGETGGRSNYDLSDFLTAFSDNGGAGYAKGSTVQLMFGHAMAMVQVSVPGGRGWGADENLKVTLTGVMVKALAALESSGTFGGYISLQPTDNDPVNITMRRVEQPADANYETSYTYRALVPPNQWLDAGSRLFRFERGEQVFTSAPLASGFYTRAGKAETFTVTLPVTPDPAYLGKWNRIEGLTLNVDETTLVYENASANGFTLSDVAWEKTGAGYRLHGKLTAFSLQDDRKFDTEGGATTNTLNDRVWVNLEMNADGTMDMSSGTVIVSNLERFEYNKFFVNGTTVRTQNFGRCTIYGASPVEIEFRLYDTNNLISFLLAMYVPAGGDRRLVEGTYTASPDKTPGTFYNGFSYTKNRTFDANGTGHTNTGGTIKVSIEPRQNLSDMYTIEFDCTLEGGGKATGTFRGPIQWTSFGTP